MSERENLFPSLADIASRTDALPDVADDDVRIGEDAKARAEQEEGEEREMQEIESLCMRCHEQVSLKMWPRGEADRITGRDEVIVDEYTLFQRDCGIVVPMRTLWTL